MPAKKRKPCPEAPRGFLNMVRMAQGKKAIITDDDDGLDVDAYNTTLNKSVNLGGAGQGGGFSAAAAI